MVLTGDNLPSLKNPLCWYYSGYLVIKSHYFFKISYRMTASKNFIPLVPPYIQMYRSSIKQLVYDARADGSWQNSEISPDSKSNFMIVSLKGVVNYSSWFYGFTWALPPIIKRYFPSFEIWLVCISMYGA